jgi:hypothetical protein
LGANEPRTRWIGCVAATVALLAGADIAHANRPSGWISWLTFPVSQAALTEAMPSQHLITK